MEMQYRQWTIENEKRSAQWQSWILVESKRKSSPVKNSLWKKRGQY